MSSPDAVSGIGGRPCRRRRRGPAGSRPRPAIRSRPRPPCSRSPGRAATALQRRILTVLAERVGADAVALFEVGPSDPWISGARPRRAAPRARRPDRDRGRPEAAHRRAGEPAPQRCAGGGCDRRPPPPRRPAHRRRRRPGAPWGRPGPGGRHGRAAPSTPRPGRRWSGSRRVLAAVERRQRVAELADRRLRQQAAVAALGQGALGGGEDLAELAQRDLRGGRRQPRRGSRRRPRARPRRPGPHRAGRLPAETLAGELLRWEPLCARVMREGEPLVVRYPEEAAGLHAVTVPRRAGSARQRADRARSAPASAWRACCWSMSRVPVAHSDDDVAFVRGLANVVALATERARVQAQLRLSVEELRKSAEDRSRLLAHIVQAQEEERQRIADDIHDDSVQVMTAVALRLATLRRRLGGGALDPLLVNLEHDVRQSITRLRHLMFVLRPPALEAHGIAAALHAFLAQVAEDAGLAYSLDDRLPAGARAGGPDRGLPHRPGGRGQHLQARPGRPRRHRAHRRRRGGRGGDQGRRRRLRHGRAAAGARATSACW